MSISTTRFAATTLMIIVLICLVNGCATDQPMPLKKYKSTTPAKAHKLTVPAKPAPEMSPAKHVPPPPSKPEFFRHTVRERGETLSHISLWYTGTAQNWKRVVRANPSLEGHKIFVGNIILIPKDLLKTRRQMPLKFVTSPSSAQLKALKNRLEVPQQKESDEINLFEPVEKTTKQPSNDRADNIELFEPVQGDE